MENERPKVLTTQGACDLLGVTRWYFETRLKSKFTKLEKVGKRNFYLLHEVEEMKKTHGALFTEKYNVIA